MLICKENTYSHCKFTLKKNIPSFEEIKNKIIKLFHKKYFVSNSLYEKIVINNIIYNEKTHIVAKFKDYLVIDDYSEFLKRFYKKSESLCRLPLYFDYYHIYSKIFPNYTSLKESKYIYKNIHKKQKMIDLAQEEESNDRNDEKDKKDLKHQRKKNKDDINTIFNNDIYNSIIKQSQDLYMLLFGIEKKKNCNDNDSKSSFSSFEIKDIIKLIEKYDYDSKIGFNYKNNLIIPKINKNINTKKYLRKENNSSLTTKQSTFYSSNIHQKINNLGNVNKKNDDIIISLKKLKNGNKSTTSNSLLISHKLSKNKLINNHIKTLCPIKSSENSKTKKETKKINKIKVNQKFLLDNNKNYLTDRISFNNKFKNLKQNFCINSNKRKNSNIVSNKNSKMKSKFINKKSIDFNYYSQINTNLNSNLNIYKHKRINTNTSLAESSKYKSYKIKLLNRAKAKNTLENNNKLNLNLKEARELFKKIKIKEKNYYTERESMTSYNKEKNKDYLISDNLKLFKKINNHKKSFPSIDFKTKINKNFLISQRIISCSKNNKYNLKTNFLPFPLGESLKINKKQIFKLYNRKTDSDLNKIEDKNFYSERVSLKYMGKNIHEKFKLIVPKDLSLTNKIEAKYYNTTTNSKIKDKLNIKNQEININKNTFPIKRIIKRYKQIKRKDISPLEFNKKYAKFSQTERNKKYLNIKMIFDKK